jgi:DnaJ-class molecular chaperone
MGGRKISMVIFRELQHKFFKREGSDLSCEVHVGVVDAALGSQILRRFRETEKR